LIRAPSDADPLPRPTLAEGPRSIHVRMWREVRRHTPAIAVVTICAGALVWRAREYMPFFVDDSFISLRYVWRLLHGLGLTWTDGERVEGYSDLLWVLLVAAGGIFDKDLIAVSRALGVLTTVLTVVALLYVYRPRSLGGAMPALLGGLGMVLTSPVAAWSIGGLEQPLLGALIAWATILAYRFTDGSASRRTATGIGVLLGLANLTRPDAFLFTATICGAVAVVTWFDARTWKPLARIVAISSTFVVGQLLFRILYYHDWVPNTAHVKLAFTATRVTQGWKYVTDAEPYLTSLILLTLAGAAAATTRRTSLRRVILPIASAAVWTAYVVVIGGDISPARRHLVLTIILMSLVVAEGIHALSGYRLRRRAAAWAFAALSLVMLARMEDRDPEKQHAIDDTWVWSGRDVGRFLSQAFQTERPLVAVDAAGTLPFYSELPCLDMLGLNDRVIATIHPADFGTGFAGHELGNGPYILSRKPDLIVFHNSSGDIEPVWRGGREMKSSPEFGRYYQLVTFETPTRMQSHMWARKEDGRIAVTRTDDEVTVPGYLLSTPQGGVAKIDPEGRLALQVDASHPGSVSVDLRAGHWSVRVETLGDVNVTVADRDHRSDGAGNADIDLGPKREDDPVKVAVAVRPGDRGYVRQVIFRRSHAG
jgi:arabinofuranosyltransferase